MTDTKPTLEEQIIYCQSIKKRIAEVLTGGGDDQCSFKGLEQFSTGEINKSILASLKELAAIRSAELPVEPDVIKKLKEIADQGHPEANIELLYIKDLKSFALKEKERAGNWQKRGELADLQKQIADAMQKRAEKAESELAALRGRMMEPDDVAGLQMIISGALYDFAAYLTTRPEAVKYGASELAGPMVDALKAWAAMRGLSLDDAAVQSWQEHSKAMSAAMLKEGE